MKNTFGWRPTWGITQAVEKTIQWSRAWLTGEDVNRVMEEQIREYMTEAR